MNTFLYRLEFSKKGDICYVGHLDFVTAFRRAIKRAKLPVKYSEGFNPHMEISVAMPLPLGMEGHLEFLEITLTEKLNTNIFADRLNKTLPHGVFINKVWELSGKAKAAALVCRAEYEIYIEGLRELASAVMDKARKLLELNEIMAVKKTKSKETLVNIRDDIFDISGSSNYGALCLNMVLSAGSEKNLKPELVMSVLLDGIADNDMLKLRFIRKRLILASELKNCEK